MQRAGHLKDSDSTYRQECRKELRSHTKKKGLSADS